MPTCRRSCSGWRAHAKRVERLPVFGGLLVVALVAGRAGVTDPLAPRLLAARVIQSAIHLGSLGPAAAAARFSAFAVQLGIAVYWVWALLAR